MAWSYIKTDQPQPHYSFPNNAEEVYNSLSLHGFSYASIIGILANMEHESYINTGQCQLNCGVPADTDLTYSDGLGLVMWDDGTKLLQFAHNTGGTWYMGFTQMDFFYENVPQAWATRTDPDTHITYSYTYDEFKQLTDMNEACKAFFWQFEYGTWNNVMITDYVPYWNNYFAGTKRKRMKLYFYTLKAFKRKKGLVL